MLDAIDFNYHRATALTVAGSKAGQALFSYDLLICDSGSPDPAFNLGFPLRGAYKLDRTLERLETHFARRKLPFRVELPRALEAEVEGVLQARGYARQPRRTPGMVLRDLTGFRPAQWEVAGLRFERVSGAPAMTAFAEAAFAGFGLPVAVAGAVLAPRLLDDPALTAFVGLLDDTPACTSLVYVTGEVGGIYWVSTLPEQRGRGLGAAATARAVVETRARGCSLASLQASDMGRPIYARMGFELDREYADYRLPS